MSEIKNHWEETRELVKSVDSKKIAHWLLESGYFPEQYIFPPSFRPQNFTLKDQPYHGIKTPRNIWDHDFKPKLTPTQILNIAYPKSELTDRIFGIYHPKPYHDLVWYIEKHWNQIVNHLFDRTQRIYSYSFPIPITSQQKGEIGPLRSGRMIYEYLELAEKDLLSESYKYKFLLKTDIKNFYPSIYTHSISWGIHTKERIRNNNEHNLRLVGNILDRIAQYGNDRKTNGIPIGPAISDLITEIILSAVDKSISKILRQEDLVAARYKDDYFFLLKNEHQADSLLKHMQLCFKEFNLFINEEKTEMYSLPDGLFRPWILRFDKIWNALNIDPNQPITFRNFYVIAQEVFSIDKEYPGTGLINKFLAKLTDQNNIYSLNIDFSKLKNKKQGVFRTYSILIHLSKRSKKSFPNSLGVLESIVRAPDGLVSENIKSSLILEMKNLNKEILKSDDEHQKLWWVYFVLSNDSLKQKIDVKSFYTSESVFLKSFNKGKQKFFTDFSDANFFSKPEEDLSYPIAKHLNIFNKE